MTSLRQQMLEEMQLRGLSSRTQHSYLNAVRQLAEYHRKPPDQIDEEELRQYFLYLMNEKQLSPSSCRVAHYAMRFLYVKTVGQAWPADLVIRPQKEIKLPVVLSVEEVQQIGIGISVNWMGELLKAQDYVLRRPKHDLRHRQDPVAKATAQ
jgi:integrase/recombinase XerD